MAWTVCLVAVGAVVAVVVVALVAVEVAIFAVEHALDCELVDDVGASDALFSVSQIFVGDDFVHRAHEEIHLFEQRLFMHAFIDSETINDFRHGVPISLKKYLAHLILPCDVAMSFIKFIPHRHIYYNMD